MGHSEGLIQGKLEGKLEGKQEESRNIALNLLNENLDIATISKCTGLSVTEIEKLKL